MEFCVARVRSNAATLTVWVALVLTIATTLLTSGCAGRASLFPNPDPALRKTSAQLAAQSAKLHYETDAPHKPDPDARAEVDYNLKQVHISNLSDSDWSNVQVWANQKYACVLPRVPRSTPAHPHLEILNFQLMYDNDGNSLPLGGVTLQKIEVYRDGIMYEIPLQLAD